MWASMHAGCMQGACGVPQLAGRAQSTTVPPHAPPPHPNHLPRRAAYAPVTKAILLSSAGASILSQAARASHRPLPSPFTAAAQLLVFKTPSELLFGSMLLYYFRCALAEAVCD